MNISAMHLPGPGRARRADDPGPRRRGARRRSSSRSARARGRRAVVDPARARPLSDHGGRRAPADPRRSRAVVLRAPRRIEFIVEGRFQGQADSPLSPLGERQAALAAAPARPSGPLPRPADPADAAARDRPLAAAPGRRDRERRREAARGRSRTCRPSRRPEAGLLEIGQGDWEGRPHARSSERWGDVLAAWRREPLTAWAPGGEPWPRSQDRVRADARDGSSRGSPRARAGFGCDRPRSRATRARRRRTQPLVDPRRPRRGVQGRAADPAGPAARAVLDVPVRPVRHHGRGAPRGRPRLLSSTTRRSTSPPRWTNRPRRPARHAGARAPCDMRHGLGRRSGSAAGR